MHRTWLKAGLLAATVLSAASASAQTWTSQNVAWRVYLSGTVCNITGPETTTIVSDAGFREYWKRLTGNSSVPRDVDFEKEQLVAINLGSRPSGGYEVWVDSIVKPNPQSIVVTYVERRPGQRDRVTAQISAPFVIVKMERQSGKLSFKPMTVDGRGGGGDGEPGGAPGYGSVGQIPWRQYLSGTTCGINAPGTTVITNQAQFQRYWKQLAGNSNLPQDIDFSREQLVAINLGSRPTGGYSVAVGEVVKPNPQSIVVTYVERRPGRRDQLENVPSSPFVIVKLERQSGQITFKPMSVDGGAPVSPGPDTMPQTGAIQWQPYMSGTTCNINAPGTTIIQTQGQFLAYWKLLTGGAGIPRDVDFSRYQLVAINLGTRPTAGYSVSVASVVKPNPQNIVVTYVEVQPRSKPNTKLTSSPYVIVMLERQSGNFSFKPMSMQGR